MQYELQFTGLKLFSGEISGEISGETGWTDTETNFLKISKVCKVVYVSVTKILATKTVTISWYKSAGLLRDDEVDTSVFWWITNDFESVLSGRWLHTFEWKHQNYIKQSKSSRNRRIIWSLDFIDPSHNPGIVNREVRRFIWPWRACNHWEGKQLIWY